MPAIVPEKLYAMSRASAIDPKKAIIDAVGDAIGQLRPMNNEIVVGTYISPDVLRDIKMRDGSNFQLIKADMNKAEDLWMGCMGLVLKKGPMAFRDDPRLDIYWDGQDVKEGDWVMFRFSSSWEQHLNGASVRFVQDREIKAVIDSPDIIVSKRSLTVA